MSTREELSENSKKIAILESTIKDLRSKPAFSLSEYQELTKELIMCLDSRQKLKWQQYIESLQCKKCEDSGWIMSCCSDEDCQGNVKCYECDICDTNLTD
jgi:RecJ-like exonuclease